MEKIIGENPELYEEQFDQLHVVTNTWHFSMYSRTEYKN